MALRRLLDVPAPCKLNLFLHVTGRRPDGYHLLQSVFVLLDWADVLHFERRDDGRLSREDLGPALPEDDLSLRAARALQQASGTAFGAHIGVDKRVPWGAGLGGGSSDAATTLLALNRLWGLDWPRERLLELALPLGADVPFFVGGRNAWVEGIGERLTPLDLPAMRFGLVKPPVAIPTAAIFGSPLLRRDTKPATVAVFLADTRNFLAASRNDLQPCAEAFSGEVGEALSFLPRRWPGIERTRMSGSGSTVFGEIGGTAGSSGGEPTAAQAAEAGPATPGAGWVVREASSLPFHPLVGWAD
jgi:4-diphosphocytidyl-2-C-methyl-D-erythritol kinase